MNADRKAFEARHLAVWQEGRWRKGSKVLPLDREVLDVREACGLVGLVRLGLAESVRIMME